MSMETLQPKWHMTFDGHLLEQAQRHGRLADKADDTIELQHQTLQKPRDRCWGITSFQRRETCIRRELRRRKSPETQKQIDTYEASMKAKSANKRVADATEHHQEQRQEKRVERQAFAEGS